MRPPRAAAALSPALLLFLAALCPAPGAADRNEDVASEVLVRTHPHAEGPNDKVLDVTPPSLADEEALRKVGFEALNLYYCRQSSGVADAADADGEEGSEQGVCLVGAEKGRLIAETDAAYLKQMENCRISPGVMRLCGTLAGEEAGADKHTLSITSATPVSTACFCDMGVFNDSPVWVAIVNAEGCQNVHQDDVAANAPMADKCKDDIKLAAEGLREVHKSREHMHQDAVKLVDLMKQASNRVQSMEKKTDSLEELGKTAREKLIAAARKTLYAGSDMKMQMETMEGASREADPKKELEKGMKVELASQLDEALKDGSKAKVDSVLEELGKRGKLVPRPARERLRRAIETYSESMTDVGRNLDETVQAISELEKKLTGLRSRINKISRVTTGESQRTGSVGLSRRGASKVPSEETRGLDAPREGMLQTAGVEREAERPLSSLAINVTGARRGSRRPVSRKPSA